MTKKPDWKQREKVVSLIEKAISPNAKVDHNVWLPDLTGSSSKRQFDVVIWAGEPPRETITVVEVQERDAQFDILTFDGLVTKMVKVGAQHLICVSSQPFPKSIIKEAEKRGPTVRLITMSQLEAGRWPVGIHRNSIIVLDREILNISKVMIGAPKGMRPIKNKQEFTGQETPFTIEGIEGKLSFIDLFTYFLDNHIDGSMHFPDGKHKVAVHLPGANERIFWTGGDSIIPVVAIDFEVEMKGTTTEIPITCSDYQQISDDENLAWIMEASGFFKGQEVNFQITLTSQGDGTYKAKNWNVPDVFSGPIQIFEML